MGSAGEAEQVAARATCCDQSSDLDLQFFDLAIQAGQSEYQSASSFLFIGALTQDSGDVQSFVVSQCGSQVICIGQRGRPAQQIWWQIVGSDLFALDRKSTRLNSSH